mmetsp:Transcript_2480/g.5136  ORF Transcript_2480/g.5136 Transcript_2480/m.5136 type:complete len:756 (+) Transcript_2480:532-2799(+)
MITTTDLAFHNTSMRRMASTPPSTCDFDPWSRGTQKSDLLNALWEAVQDEELFDVLLVSSDGEECPASRFVLAARSPVLKRMLYGSFREAKSSSIAMMGYERTVLQAVIQYCHTNQLPTLLASSGSLEDDLECRTRLLVRLDHAADFLELNGLAQLVHLEVRRMVGLYPTLACVVFDEVDDVHSLNGDYAKLMIELRPYEALSRASKEEPQHANGANNNDSNNMGGVEYLRAERLKLILQSQSIMCGELYLFRVLRQWYDQKSATMAEHLGETAEKEQETSSLLEAAVDCAKCINMENIEPESLLKVVQHCPFVNPSFLFDAFARQALRASQNRVWTLHSRPAKYQATERVLVEDCGLVQARGMYVRMVSGLKKGTLYTKREVASGQAVVYTLSCSVSQGHVECRIFSSPLLTPMAVQSFYNGTASSDPTFQPILQVVAVKAGSTKNSIVVSDGQNCMHATLANSLVLKKPVLLYGVIQVLAFRVYSGKTSGDTKIHIQRASIVNSNAGQIFGRPKFFSSNNVKSRSLVATDDDLFDDDDTTTVADSVALTTTSSGFPGSVCASVDECSTFAGNFKDPEHVTKLYSCKYPLKKQRNETSQPRIPQDGWKSDNVEDVERLDPPPVCTWFPAVRGGSSKETSSLVLKKSTSKSKGKPPKHRKSSASSVTSNASILSGGSETSGSISNSSAPLQISRLESLLNSTSGDEAIFGDDGDSDGIGPFVDEDDDSSAGAADLHNTDVDNFTAVSALSSVPGA